MAPGLDSVLSGVGSPGGDDTSNNFRGFCLLFACKSLSLFALQPPILAHYTHVLKVRVMTTSCDPGVSEGHLYATPFPC